MLKKIKSPLSLSLLWFLTPLYFLFLSLQSLFFSFVITFIKHFLSYKRNPTISIVLPSFVLWQTPLSDLINVKRIMTFTSSTASHLNPCVQPIYIFHQQNILVCFPSFPVFNFSFVFCLLDTCWWRQVTTASWRHGIWGGSTIPSRFRNAVWPMKSTGHWMHRGFWWPRTTAPWCKKACLCFFVTTLHLTHLHCISGICL